MKLKRFVTVIIIVLSLIVCIGAVSAEDGGDVVQNVTPGADTPNPPNTEDTQNTQDSQSTQDTQNTQNTQNPTQTTSQPAKKPVKKIRTDVDADSVVVVHKKKGYFKVKVEDDEKDRPVKQLKLKLKVYTKSKSKTYTIKTDYRGIAKFNTKHLKLGKHKVIITSADEKYDVKEKSYIFVGKKHTVSLKAGTSKKLKNRDVIKVYKKYDDDDVELKVAFKGKPKKTSIIKAVFYFKNKYTGKIIKKVDYAEYDEEDGRWEYPNEDYSWRFTPVKVKITYVSA